MLLLKFLTDASTSAKFFNLGFLKKVFFKKKKKNLRGPLIGKIKTDKPKLKPKIPPVMWLKENLTLFAKAWINILDKI